MFDNLLLNKRTKSKLDAYLSNPSQALLIVGPVGAGKNTLARAVAAGLLEISSDKLEGYAHFIVVGLPHDKQEIPIDAIRELKKTLQLQVPGNKPVRRVALIENAHLMNQEAQNAFLKSLEEPAPGTAFILSADSVSGLLDTITSRTAVVDVNPLSLEDCLKFFDGHAEKEVSAAWTLGQGLPGLMHALLGAEDNDLRQAVDQAKEFIKSDPYERLLALEVFKDKYQIIYFLGGLARVLQALYRSAANRGDNKTLRRVISSAEEVFAAQSDLEANVMPRLVILKLVLSLSI